MPSSLLCFFLVLLLLLPPPPLSCAANTSSDALALLSFKQSVSNSSTALSSWNSSSLPQICSSWKGVSCSNSSPQRVSQLHLSGKSLFGLIPPKTLGLLHSLDSLSLHSNQLSGSLPLDLANCSLLRRLYLQNNRFSGPLPYNFSSWPLLTHLDLSSNNFSAPIPSSLGSLTQLKVLYLQNNSLSGNIPQLNLTSRTNFSVANNQLNGPIPSSLAGFPASSFAGNIGLCGPPLPACPSSPTHNLHLRTGAIVGIVVGAAALFVSLLFLCFCLLCRGKEKETRTNDNLFAAGRTEFERNRGATTSTDAEKRDKAMAVSATKGREDIKKLIFFDNRRHTFELQDLLRASAEVLGKGNLGTSYKAALEDGMVVVVKRLRNAVNDNDDCRQRIEILGRLIHDNLVPLRAYYFATDEKLVVSDYMPNGSLSALLHGSTGTGRTPLDWDTRVRIALSAGRGLAYLHGCEFVHGNVKSSNVLLTRSYDACLADYGLVQLVSFPPDSNKAVGYIAPEVLEPKRVTPKADVYSYGVLLLELLTGKAPARAASDNDGVDLPRWVQSVVCEEWTAEVFDQELMKDDNIQEEMVQLLQVAMPCVAPSPDERPTMQEVVKMIENLKKTDGDLYAGGTSEIDTN